MSNLANSFLSGLQSGPLQLNNANLPVNMAAYLPGPDEAEHNIMDRLTMLEHSLEQGDLNASKMRKYLESDLLDDSIKLSSLGSSGFSQVRFIENFLDKVADAPLLESVEPEPENQSVAPPLSAEQSPTDSPPVEEAAEEEGIFRRARRAIGEGRDYVMRPLARYGGRAVGGLIDKGLDAYEDLRLDDTELGAIKDPTVLQKARGMLGMPVGLKTFRNNLKQDLSDSLGDDYSVRDVFDMGESIKSDPEIADRKALELARIQSRDPNISSADANRAHGQLARALYAPVIQEPKPETPLRTARRVVSSPRATVVPTVTPPAPPAPPPPPVQAIPAAEKNFSRELADLRDYTEGAVFDSSIDPFLQGVVNKKRTIFRPLDAIGGMLGLRDEEAYSLAAKSMLEERQEARKARQQEQFNKQLEGLTRANEDTLRAIVRDPQGRSAYGVGHEFREPYAARAGQLLVAIEKQRADEQAALKAERAAETIRIQAAREAEQAAKRAKHEQAMQDYYARQARSRLQEEPRTLTPSPEQMQKQKWEQDKARRGAQERARALKAEEAAKQEAQLAAQLEAQRAAEQEAARIDATRRKDLAGKAQAAGLRAEQQAKQQAREALNAELAPVLRAEARDNLLKARQESANRDYDELIGTPMRRARAQVEAESQARLQQEEADKREREARVLREQMENRSRIEGNLRDLGARAREHAMQDTRARAQEEEVLNQRVDSLLGSDRASREEISRRLESERENRLSEEAAFRDQIESQEEIRRESMPQRAEAAGLRAEEQAKQQAREALNAELAPAVRAEEIYRLNQQRDARTNSDWNQFTQDIKLKQEAELQREIQRRAEIEASIRAESQRSARERKKVVDDANFQSRVDELNQEQKNQESLSPFNMRDRFLGYSGDDELQSILDRSSGYSLDAGNEDLIKQILLERSYEAEERAKKLRELDALQRSRALSPYQAQRLASQREAWLRRSLGLE